jgi:hypothetical protein
MRFVGASAENGASSKFQRVIRLRERQTTRAVPLVKGRLSGCLTAPLVFLVSPASHQRVADRVIRVCMAQITRAKPTTSAGKSHIPHNPHYLRCATTNESRLR